MTVDIQDEEEVPQGAACASNFAFLRAWLGSLRPYEIASLVFGSLVFIALQYANFPLSGSLAKGLFLRGMKLSGTVIVLASFISITLYLIKKKTFDGIATRVRDEALNWNYISITFRRVFSVLFTLYFFLHLKHVILLLHFSNYDAELWKLDKFLHFGINPNQFLLESLGQFHTFVLLVDWLYVKYFSVTFFGPIPFLLHMRGYRAAERIVLAMVLLWSLGGLLYVAIPADGPCYAVLSHEAVPEGMRQHLFKYPVIDEVPETYTRAFYEAKIWHAKLYQERLWKTRFPFLFHGKKPQMFYGIAAMPSLHVAAVTLLFLFYLELSLIAAIAMGCFASFIVLGSVLLQWHYAVDAYAGILLALLSLWVSRRFVRGDTTPSICFVKQKNGLDTSSKERGDSGSFYGR